jgi:hypothetical protein
MADEKDEKGNEKDREKREEKEPGEKYRRDPLGAVIWAAILIWAGVVLLLNNMGYLEGIKDMVQAQVPDWIAGSMGVWGLIFFGAGIILLIEVLLRLVVPAWRRSVTGTLIVAFVFIGIGLSNLVAWEIIWPLILIGIGIVIVIRVLFGRKGPTIS